jgi:(p)ppGpp synthase/HD superfamily hydrolase
VTITTNDSNQPQLGARFEEALNRTFELHHLQIRKGSGVSYLGHLLGVASIVIDAGGTEDQAIAALLHDAIEDAGGEAARIDIEAQFGSGIAEIVSACSDTDQDPKPPWRERKEQYLEHLELAPDTVLLVSLADKLYNARAIVLDHAEVGDRVWDRFSVGRDGQLWYYRALANVFGRRLPGPLSAELESAVQRLETPSKTAA